MRTLVHRRRAQAAVPAALGPGGTIGPLLRRLTAPLTWVGWLSVVGAVAYLGVRVWPWAMGDRAVDANGLTPLALLHEFASLTTILLPAALELGYPAVARRNPWLLRGMLLLALAQLSVLLIGWLRDWAVSTLVQDADTMDLEFAVGQVHAVARILLLTFGWLGILRGLVTTGARPGTAVAVAFVGVAIALWGALYLPSLDQLWTSDHPLMSVMNVAALPAGLAQSAATAVVVSAFLTGAVRRLHPVLGWRLGAAFAMAVVASDLAILVRVLLGPFTRPDGSQDNWVFTVTAFLSVASSLLLIAACLAGIGRGTEDRRVTWPRRRTHLVSGARRLRPARG